MWLCLLAFVSCAKSKVQNCNYFIITSQFMCCRSSSVRGSGGSDRPAIAISNQSLFLFLRTQLTSSAPDLVHSAENPISKWRPHTNGSEKFHAAGMEGLGWGWGWGWGPRWGWEVDDILGWEDGRSRNRDHELCSSVSMRKLSAVYQQS